VDFSGGNRNDVRVASRFAEEAYGASRLGIADNGNSWARRFLESSGNIPVILGRKSWGLVKRILMAVVL